MEMEGRYGGRASEKAEGRDTIAMDTGNDVPGGLADGVYNPAPEESSWQGQGGTGGRWGARRSDRATGRDAWSPEARKKAAEARRAGSHPNPNTGKLPFAPPADLETRKDKPGFMDRLLFGKNAKYVKGKDEGRWGARRSEKADGRDAEMAYGEELGADSYAAQMQELDDKLKSGMITKAQYDELCAKLENPEAVIDYDKSGYERSGRSEGGMSTDELTPAEKQKFEALKRRRSEGQLSEAENAEFVSLRDKVGRIGFRSAGATRDDFSPEARKKAAEARKAKATTAPKREKPHPATRNYGERRVGGPAAAGSFTSSRGRPIY